MEQPARSTKDTLVQVTQERLDMLTGREAQFDAVSDEIVAWMNLGIQQLGASAIDCMLVPICEKATSSGPGAGDSETRTYARLCGKMMEQVDPNVKDDNVKKPNGQPVVGAQVLRRYLTGWCREAVQRLWPVQKTEPSISVASTVEDANEDQASQGFGEAEQDSHASDSPLPSDADHSAVETKSRRLKLITFLCELFKLGGVTERPVHECIKEILSDVETAESPDEEEIEGLCKLWTSIGELLDTPKAAAHINMYIGHMAMLTKSLNISSRIRLMLLDIIDLRERKWIPHDDAATLTMNNNSSDLARKEAVAEKYAGEYANLRASQGLTRPRRVVQDATSSTRPSSEPPSLRLSPGHPRCGPISSPPPFSLIKSTSISTGGHDGDDVRPSAVATAHAIQDISSVQYPEGIKGPQPGLNDVAPQGKFRYDLDFLLQFQDVCTMKPDSLRPLSA
ncbi:armadillo-type protein [Cubamyces lactineus]|nr:armadillo-type protein [Cubamyces lactineus]